jgi:uncharacterized membrane protein
MLFFLIPLFVLVCGVLPWIFVGLVLADRREVRALRARIEKLEGALGAPAPVPALAPAAVAPAASRAPAPARGPRDTNRLEEQVGGIWMQNVGSVLLLLGAFFLIVWGYATGRVGPEVLVLAGVALGAVLVWRGAVIARSLTALGNALIGVGLGVVYITLYLGHFRMGVLPSWAAFALLTLVSLVTVGIGLSRREPIIATLGVVGAHLPQLLAIGIPLQGFRLSTHALLGYFAVVNAVVFALAATVGWSGLVILSLLLTSLTWSAGPRAVWGLGTELVLTALFLALGLAPVARLIGSASRVRPIDLAVVALAPLLLILSSLPFLAAARVRAAEFLLALAALYAAAAGWVGSRRRERDLWKPLTAAATVLLAASIERGLLPGYLALAWCAEGAALVWLGLSRGGGWLRLLGYAVLSLSALRLLASLAFPEGHGGLLGAPALRDLLTIAAFLALSHVIGRSRDRLTPEERHLPGFSVVASNLLLMIWIAREAERLRHVLPGVAGPYAGEVSWLITAAAWLLQAAILIRLADRLAAPVLRHAGYLVSAAATFTLFVGMAWSDPRAGRGSPFLNTPSVILLLAAALLTAIAEMLWRQRGKLSPAERSMPQVAAAVANLALLPWWARESGHLARALSGPPDGTGLGSAYGASAAARTLAAVFTSAGWTLQAIVLFTLGWVRESAFLRWSGLCLFGLTVLKFLVVDLDRVDAFWRFVSAIGIGAALLVVSFLYQRRARGATGGPSS